MHENQPLSWNILSYNFIQEIIKLSEWIPHVGPPTKVIPVKLFLDIVPSSSEDVTRTMRGQKKATFLKLPEKKWR